MNGKGRAVDFKTASMQIALKMFIILFTVATQLFTSDQGRARSIDAKQTTNEFTNTGNCCR